MKIQIRSDHVHISGYVNAVERWSRPLTDRDGRRFVEKIAAGAFRDALERADSVGVMLNHDRALTDTREKGITLTEDSIGLHFDGDIFDAEVIAAAKKRELRGWSFGFRAVEEEEGGTDVPGADYARTVRALELLEVSIIDSRKLPAYPATSVEVRDGGEIELRAMEAEDVETQDDGEEQQEPQAVPQFYVLKERLKLKSK